MRTRKILLFLACIGAMVSPSQAKDQLYGCWNNIQQVPANPAYSPAHQSTTAEGYIVCFGKSGRISTTSVGGFEALGTEGRYVFRRNRLDVKEQGLADGWIFAHGSDTCRVDVFATQLRLHGCRRSSLDEVLRRSAPDLSGVAAGVYSR